MRFYRKTLCRFGMVKRISQCIGAPELELTYREMIAANSSDSMAIVKVAISLDQSVGVPESAVREEYSRLKRTPLSAWLIRSLVWEHLHLFHVDYATRQRLCESVDLKFKSGLGTGANEKRLPNK